MRAIALTRSRKKLFSCHAKHNGVERSIWKILHSAVALFRMTDLTRAKYTLLSPVAPTAIIDTLPNDDLP